MGKKGTAAASSSSSARVRAPRGAAAAAAAPERKKRAPTKKKAAAGASASNGDPGASSSSAQPVLAPPAPPVAPVPFDRAHWLRPGTWRRKLSRARSARLQNAPVAQRAPRPLDPLFPPETPREHLTHLLQQQQGQWTSATLPRPQRDANARATAALWTLLQTSPLGEGAHGQVAQFHRWQQAHAVPSLLHAILALTRDA